MHNRFSIAVVSLLFLLVISCTKDKVPAPSVPYQANLAPCEIDEASYDSAKIYYEPSNMYPLAKYRIKFMGSPYGNIEFAFNKVPVTGRYNLVYEMNENNQNNPNQMAFVYDYGSFLVRSAYTENREVCIEKNDNELIISFCKIQDTTISYDPINICYVGNRPHTFKIRKQF